jgi:hypothetical protein
MNKIYFSFQSKMRKEDGELRGYMKSCFYGANLLLLFSVVISILLCVYKFPAPDLEFAVGCAGACVHVLAQARSSFLSAGLRFRLLILMPVVFWVRALPRVFLFFPSCRAPDLCPRGLNFCSFSCQDLQHPVVFSVELAISCSVSLRSCLASAHRFFPGQLSVAHA